MENSWGRSWCSCRLGQVQGGPGPGDGTMEELGDGVGAGAGLDRYTVFQYLVREPCKSQGGAVGAGAGLDRYTVVQYLVRGGSRGRCRGQSRII